MVQGTAVDEPPDDADSDKAPAPPKPKKLKKPKSSKPSPAPKVSRAKPLATAPPAPSVQSEDLSRISKSEKKKKKPMHTTGPALTPAAILRNETEAIDLSSDDDLGDDALELLIKSKQEAEIFNDLPLFDVDILNNFIDEWFANPDLGIDDLQLPIGISVAFQGAIGS